jgi:hypothetical protein
MMPSALHQELNRRIRNPLGRLKDEADLRWVLKRRLTKKEYKILDAVAAGTPTPDALRERLGLDAQRYAAMCETITRKLNQDRIKRELFES